MKYLHMFFLSLVLGCAGFMYMQTMFHGIELSKEQEERLNKLTNLYKFQISRHFDLCKMGKNPHYKRQEPGEFEHLVKKSEKEISDTIQNIIKLYAEIGMPQDNIHDEEVMLRAGVQDCLES